MTADIIWCSRAAGRAASAALALLALSTAPVAAQPRVSVRNAWMRLIVPNRPVAGYFTMRNDGDSARTIVGVDSPACGMMMMHESIHSGGQDRMRSLSTVEVPAHGSVTFSPGRYHIMCMKPAASLRVGGTARVTFHFKDGATIEAPFPVKGASGE